jgi:UAA transporter family
MQYINYPAKTLMKSSRVVFTMLFGVLIQRKAYKPADYMIVVAMVTGLATFMHADASSSAVFHHIGVIMLTISLFCDGAISNVSETIMNQYGVGQDEVNSILLFLGKYYDTPRFLFLHLIFVLFSYLVHIPFILDCIDGHSRGSSFER